MQRVRSVLVLTVAAGLWPAVAAYATDPAPPPQPVALGSQLQPAQPAFTLYSLAPDRRPEGPVTGLRLGVIAAPPPPGHDAARPGAPVDTALPAPRSDELRQEAGSTAPLPTLPSSLGASRSSLKLFLPTYAPKPGWEMSGRAGPLRWLKPLDGEGETKLRLGGRIQGQPRMPGMGLFNIGIHYNFE